MYLFVLVEGINPTVKEKSVSIIQVPETPARPGGIGSGVFFLRTMYLSVNLEYHC